MHPRAQRAAGLEQQLPQFLADRIGKRDVPDDPAPEERVLGGFLGAVHELVGQDDVARLIARLERPDRADAENPGDVELLQGPDVSAGVQLAGQQAMAASVPRQKDHFAPREDAGEQAVRRRAERRLDLDPGGPGQRIDLVEAGAADEAHAPRQETNWIHAGRHLWPDARPLTSTCWG
jgi:hypothetical protein